MLRGVGREGADLLAAGHFREVETREGKTLLQVESLRRVVARVAVQHDQVALLGFRLRFEPLHQFAADAGTLTGRIHHEIIDIELAAAPETRA